MPRIATSAAVALLFWAPLMRSSVATAEVGGRTNRWESDIVAFEASDRTNSPPRNAVLFIGSSSIRLWTTLAEDFSEHRVINRGFGGSEISDSVHFVHRIVAPYRPRLIVMYAGGNDINAGESPEQIASDFQEFVRKVHAVLPATRIAYISIAPNPARWAQVDQVKAANKLIQEFTRQDSRLGFIDVFSHMLNKDGQPRPDIFVEDRLHLNANGYELWKGLVGPHLLKLSLSNSAEIAPQPPVTQ